MRPLLFSVSAVIAALITWWGVLAALDVAKIESAPVSLSMVDALELLSNKVEAAGDSAWVLFLGDSTTIAFPDALEQSLNENALPEVAVHAFAIPGETPFDQYFLSTRFIEEDPDCIVLSVNLAAFSKMFATRFGKIELVGLLTPARLFEVVHLPLRWLGATLDQVLLSMLIVGSGGIGTLKDLRIEQARVGKAWDRVDDWLREMRGLAKQEYAQVMAVRDIWMTDGHQRLSREGSIRAYGQVLAGLAVDHPVLQVHSRALRAYRQAGIPVLVYVVPSDIEHLRELGLVDETALQLSVTRIGEMAKAEGAAYVDLHDLLPDRVFVDAGGHFAARDGIDPTMLVQERLSPVLRKILQGN